MLLLDKTKGGNTSFWRPRRSKYEVPIALPSCNTADPQVKIISTNADWKEINSPAKRIFCVKAGDHTAAGRITIKASGTAKRPRVLRRLGNPARTPPPWEQRKAKRAIVRALLFTGASNWIVDGLMMTDPTFTYRPLDVASDSDNNVFNRLLLEKAKGFVLLRSGADGTVIQNSVMRQTRTGDLNSCIFMLVHKRGNKSRLIGVTRTRIVNNELIDCAADGIQASGDDNHLDKSPGDIAGTIIDNNDFYVTRRLYARCDGTRDPKGACSCSENAIDLKVAVRAAKPAAKDLVRITNNRMWGYRRSVSGVGAAWCPGLASKAPAITAHHAKSDYVLVEGNIIFDSENGIWFSKPGPDHWSIRNNLFFDIANKTAPWAALALTHAVATEVYDNTIIKAKVYLRTAATGSSLDVRANVMVSAGAAADTRLGPGSTVRANAYYGTIPFFQAERHKRREVRAAKHVHHCFLIKQHTSPNWACIPRALPTRASPHYRSMRLGTAKGIGVDDRTIRSPHHGFAPRWPNPWW